MLLLLSCVASVALACLSAGAAASTDVRGAPPEEQKRYTSGVFECVVRGELKALRQEYINDDYCDCDNGEDEPGTSACSHLLPSVFYCGNDGYFPKKVRSESRMISVHVSLVLTEIHRLSMFADPNVSHQ